MLVILFLAREWGLQLVALLMLGQDSESVALLRLELVQMLLLFESNGMVEGLVDGMGK
jgi:hypothetical protein